MSQLAEQDDESSRLSELFASIWHNIEVVVIVTLFTTISTAYYAFKIAVPVYEASSRFELLQDTGSEFSLGEAAGLAAIAGIGLPGAATESGKLQDRILSRSFIDRIYDEAGFETDPIFNAYIAPPSLQTRLKWLVRGKPPKYDPTREDIIVSTIAILSERMVLFVADNGVIKLSVFHSDPKKAALLANLLVEQSLTDIFNRKRGETRDSLNYFAEELLQIRDNLDSASQAVRDYAVSNNIKSASDFAQTSTQLSQLRQNVTRVENYLTALDFLGDRIGSGFSGEDFLAAHPAVLDLEFRSTLGWSPNPETWIMPSKNAIERAINTFSVKLGSAERSLATVENQARLLGEQALELAALEREVHVQQAIYESVITQFEARSLLTGFEQASGHVIETAIPARNPTSPKKMLLVGLAVVSGLFVGAIIAATISIQKGTLFGLNAIRQSFPSKYLGLRLNLKKIAADSDPLSLPMAHQLQSIAAFVPESAKTVSVISTGNKGRGADLAVGLAKVFSSKPGRYAILDLGSELVAPAKGGWVPLPNGMFEGLELNSSISIIRPSKHSAFAQQTNSKEIIDGLASSFDKVIVLVSSPAPMLSLLRVAFSCSGVSFIVARGSKTTRYWASEVERAATKFGASDPILLLTRGG